MQLLRLRAEDTHKIGTVGIHLTAVVPRGDVDLRLVDETNDLNIGGGLHELHALQRIGRDEARPTTRLRAPGYRLALSVSNDRVRLRGPPQAEVWRACQERCWELMVSRSRTIHRVHERRLAERLRAFRRGVAEVVAELDAADQVVLV